MSKTNTRLIKTTELAIGMFVAELDRPWLESSLAFKGFAIKSQSDIDLLQRNCEYVYIDMEHGSRTPEVGSEPKPKTTLDEATHHKTTSYKPPTAAEHKKAIDAYAHMEVAYKQICADVERGTRVNLNTAAKAMTHMIASLQDNPDAMLQLIMLNERQATPVSDAITTSVLATAIGHRIGTSGKALYVLAVGGLLYDVGKLTLPRELLNEPRRLTPAEFKVVKSHVEAGVRILSEAEGSNPVLVGMAQHHHERCDGTGYPAGLVQKDIPTFAKIAALVDCFNAITTHRPHAPCCRHIMRRSSFLNGVMWTSTRNWLKS
jgi:HD-GYP domain-containing protein (c-di-GMP phosphodiesterase class II)